MVVPRSSFDRLRDGLSTPLPSLDEAPIDPEMLDEISSVYENNAVVFSWQAQFTNLRLQ